MSFVESIPEDAVHAMIPTFQNMQPVNTVLPNGRMFDRLQSSCTSQNRGEQQLLISKKVIPFNNDVSMNELAMNALEAKVWHRNVTDMSDTNLSSITCGFNHRHDLPPCELDTTSEAPWTSFMEADSCASSNAYKAEYYWGHACKPGSVPARSISEPIPATASHARHERISLALPENVKPRLMSSEGMSTWELDDVGMLRAASCPLAMDDCTAYVPQALKNRSFRLKYL